MPGESPQRNWDALLSPPTVGQQITALNDRKRRRRVMLAARIVAIAVLAATVFVWLGMWGYALSVPWPWSLLAVLVWVAAGGIMLGVTAWLLRRLGRALIPLRYWELDPEE